MNPQRKDTLERYFNSIVFMEKFSNVTLWISIGVSFLLLYLGDFQQFKDAASILFIAVTFLYFASSNFGSLYLSRRAQDKRITNLISDSFGVSLDDEETNLYYNNSQSPSMVRLGMNVFENSLFSKRITDVMIVRERIKIIVFVALWVIFMSNRTASLELLSVIAQTLLTTTIITNYIKLELLHHGFENSYESCRKLFLNNKKRDALFTSQVLDIVMKYENLKASMGIKLSSKIFHKINAETTEEWEKIKRKLGIS